MFADCFLGLQLKLVLTDAKGLWSTTHHETFDDLGHAFSVGVHLSSLFPLQLKWSQQRSPRVADGAGMHNIPTQDLNSTIGIFTLQEGLYHARIVLRIVGALDGIE